MKNSEIQLGMTLKLPENKVPIYNHETGTVLHFIGGQNNGRVMLKLPDGNTVPFYSRDLTKA